MNIDDNFDEDDFEFNSENFNSGEREDTGDDWKLKPLREAALHLRQLAKQIWKTVEAISETLPDDENKMLSKYKQIIIEDALTIQVKISGAMAVQDYLLMSENAVVIKLAARSLFTITSGLEMFGYNEKDYLKALRSELEDFKTAFVRWVRAFPKEDPIYPDGWGLFYTPEDIEKWNILNPDNQVEE